jgi:hypothetical protein
MDNDIKEFWNQHSETPLLIQNKIEEFVLNNISKPQILKPYLILFQHLVLEHTFDRSTAIKLVFVLRNSSNLTDDISDFLFHFESIISIFFQNDFEFKKISNFENSQKLNVISHLIGAYVAQKNFLMSEKAFLSAVNLTSSLNKTDSIHKLLAIQCNNLACAIEDVPFLTPAQETLLEDVALFALKEWEFAGSWLEIQRAHYRLASGYLKINKFIDSVIHANKCLTICQNNSANELELFFAYEILAKIEKKSGQQVRSFKKMLEMYEKLSEADKQHTRKNLDFFAYNK